ncbi:DUF6205 family protein [Streptomyces sp. NPDC002920]
MGYYTRVTGEIRIEPPLTWQEFKDSPFNPHSTEYDDSLDAKLLIHEETVDTDDGPLLRRTAPELVAAHTDSYKAYRLVEDVQKAIDTFTGHTFSGRLECKGEDGALWRVIVRDGRAQQVEPRIVWPDEDGAA